MVTAAWPERRLRHKVGRVTREATENDANCRIYWRFDNRTDFSGCGIAANWQFQTQTGIFNICPPSFIKPGPSLMHTRQIHSHPWQPR